MFPLGNISYPSTQLFWLVDAGESHGSLADAQTFASNLVFVYACSSFLAQRAIGLINQRGLDSLQAAPLPPFRLRPRGLHLPGSTQPRCSLTGYQSQASSIQDDGPQGS